MCIVFCLGGFYSLMSFVGTVLERFERSSLGALWKVLDMKRILKQFMEKKTVTHVFSGKAISRTLRFLIDHCLKTVQIQRFFRSVFSCIRTEFEDLRSYLRIQCEYRKIRTRKNFLFGYFSHSGWCSSSDYLVSIYQVSVARSNRWF